MDVSWVLYRQIAVERERVQHAGRALEGRDFTTGLTPRAAERHELVRKRFLKALTDLDAELEALLSVRGSPDRTWKKFRRVREGVGVMVQECFALLQGSMERRDPVQSEACEFADALLRELTSATGIERVQLTILAGEESFTPRTEMIRQRFAESVPWALPVMAHEFGHLLVQEHRALLGQWASLPLQDLFEGKPEELKRRELFSDLFAIYALGPAYACTCLLMRFDPSKEANEVPGATHPSDAKRAYFLLKALDRLRDADSGLTKPFGKMNEKLTEIWEAGLRQLDQNALPDATAAELRAWLESFWAKLNSQVGGARYGASRWTRAKRLSDDFVSRRKPVQVLAEADGVIDVLNGAWRWRLHNWAAYEANSRWYDTRAYDLLRVAAAR